MSSTHSPESACIIGAGPAGLIAAEVLAQAGVVVDVYDAMPSAGRKLLRAGIGGLNISHAEPLPRFISRYAERATHMTPLLESFGPEQLLAWVHGLDIETFVGSSQRIFPRDKKAAPLLRAWLQRLRGLGVKFQMRWRWLGWQDSALLFETPEGQRTIESPCTLLALGGASWPQLGSDGRWWPLLQAQNVPLAPLRPSNCGFQVAWSPYFREHFARQPVKAVRARLPDGDWHQAELMVTPEGIEGGLIYALSAPLRETIAQQGHATLWLDLNPGREASQLRERLSQAQGSRSLSKHLKDKAGIDGLKAALLREVLSAEQMRDPALLAATIKQLPLQLGQPFDIKGAISSAGGVCFEALDERLMLRERPGVFVAGEMLDWEAPTGGYLLTGCFATGWKAGQGMLSWMNRDTGGHS